MGTTTPAEAERAGLTLGVPRETRPDERRVAITPTVIAALAKAGVQVVVESGAGEAAGFPDAAYADKGATIAGRADAFACDVLAVVRVLDGDAASADREALREGQVVVGMAAPLAAPEVAEAVRARGATLFSLELVPRISRAQAMDVLSSQANVAGYKAVLLAADALPRMFPLLTTAAGTIAPARVFVIGAGVAGLSAIATARRLGAVVEAYDVRPAVKEEVQSLGARFVELELETGQSGEGSGAYASELTDDTLRRQRELMAKTIAASDVVITTATAHYFLEHDHLGKFELGVLGVEMGLGFLVFTGSLMAAGKLQEVLPERPTIWAGQKLGNFSVLGGALAIIVILIFAPSTTWLVPVLIGLALAFGALLIIPIGGADMPTVIALLNAYAGLSAAALGFVLDDQLLIVAGALDGASGLILAIIMCRAMNRSFSNVLFGAFGQLEEGGKEGGEAGQVRSASPDEAAEILASARMVVIVPGYGMAVAQAQHKVRDLSDALAREGVDVRFAIHPVAGRMPGHMNVLLAEANVPYDQLYDMEDINPDFPQADVVLVLGANDVVNPAARHNRSSPIYGMPILDVDKAQCVDGREAQHAGRLRRDRERALLRPKDPDGLRRREGRGVGSGRRGGRHQGDDRAVAQAGAAGRRLRRSSPRGA